MNIDFILEFECNSNQTIIPDQIRFTSSKNNQTASLTLIFYNPILFSPNSDSVEKTKLIKSIYFFQDEYKFSTKNIKIIWSKGRPLALESIFLITSEEEIIKLKKLFDYLSKKETYYKN